MLVLVIVNLVVSLVILALVLVMAQRAIALQKRVEAEMELYRTMVDERRDQVDAALAMVQTVDGHMQQLTAVLDEVSPYVKRLVELRRFFSRSG